MKKVNRRKFIGQAAMGLGSAWLLSRLPMKAGCKLLSTKHPIGFQTYPLRETIGKDFPGNLKMMADLGYQYLEMCSPSGYADSGFGPLASMKTADIRRIINDAGLTCPSCHFGFGELRDNLDNRLEFARELGLSHVVCSSFDVPENATMKDFLDASDSLNKIAEKISAAGFQTGYHNHEKEFGKRDGALIYDAIMGQLDPKLVKMQFQTEVITLGYKASTYFNKYPGRFISSHMSDWTADKKQVPIGKGVMEWKEFIDASHTGGVKYYFVEMDPETFKDSAIYLNDLLDKS